MYPIVNIFLLELREWLWNYALAESEQAFDLAATPYNKSRARTALSTKTGLLTKQATKKVIQGSFRAKNGFPFRSLFAVHIQFNPKRFFTSKRCATAWHFCKTSAFFGPPTLPHVHNNVHAPSFAHIHCHSYPQTSFSYIRWYSLQNHPTQHFWSHCMSNINGN